MSHACAPVTRNYRPGTVTRATATRKPGPMVDCFTHPASGRSKRGQGGAYLALHAALPYRHAVRELVGRAKHLRAGWRCLRSVSGSPRRHRPCWSSLDGVALLGSRAGLLVSPFNGSPGPDAGRGTCCCRGAPLGRELAADQPARARLSAEVAPSTRDMRWLPRATGHRT
jgi:hypothetical protein